MNGKLPVMELLILILDRSKAVQAFSSFKKKDVVLTLSCWGEGTASPEIMDILGIGEKSKVVMFSIVPRRWLPSVITYLSDEMQLRNAGRGILFTLPLSSLSRGVVRRYEAAMSDKKNEERVMYKNTEKDHELILIVTEDGLADPAMDVARAAGAKGGTVLRARAANDDDTDSFFGLKLYDEMEILFIVAPCDIKMQIMEAAGNFLREKSPEKSFLFSLPVSNIVGIGAPIV